MNVGEVYRAESRAVLATLIRLLGDFDLAEEALQDAFTAAVERWGDEPPANPRAWLVSTGRFKAIDRLRRRARFDKALGQLALLLEADEPAPDPDLPDDRLRLIFTCCHPALPADAQVAMTLREVCGLTTEEIARAFLAGRRRWRSGSSGRRRRSRPRASRTRCRGAMRSPTGSRPCCTSSTWSSPRGTRPPRATRSSAPTWPTRRSAWAASSSSCSPRPEPRALLALMLLQDSRRAARATPDGDLVLLADQDRSRWDRGRIAEAAGLLREAGGGPYALQAAIAATHAAAPTAADTDWDRIVALYDALARTDPSPVVALNRAVAVSMRDGPAAGLALVDAIDGLDGYHLAHATRADLLRRLGRADEARDAYARALALTRQEPQRRFLERRLGELYSVTDDSIGRSTRNRVSPGLESTRMSPWCLLTTMRYEMSRPRPVPSPTGLVVKNGSKMRGRISGGMPGPVSRDLDDHEPVVARRCGWSACPSPPIASSALSMRLVQTWLSSAGVGRDRRQRPVVAP